MAVYENKTLTYLKKNKTKKQPLVIYVQFPNSHNSMVGYVGRRKDIPRKGKQQPAQHRGGEQVGLQGTVKPQAGEGSWCGGRMGRTRARQDCGDYGL